MTTAKKSSRRRALGRGISVGLQIAAALVLSAGLAGCVVIGGSRHGGLFIVPGGVGLLVIVLLFLLLSRRR